MYAYDGFYQTILIVSNMRGYFKYEQFFTFNSDFFCSKTHDPILLVFAGKHSTQNLFSPAWYFDMAKDIRYAWQ